MSHIVRSGPRASKTAQILHHLHCRRSSHPGHPGQVLVICSTCPCKGSLSTAPPLAHLSNPLASAPGFEAHWNLHSLTVRNCHAMSIFKNCNLVKKQQAPSGYLRKPIGIAGIFATAPRFHCKAPPVFLKLSQNCLHQQSHVIFTIAKKLRCHKPNLLLRWSPNPAANLSCTRFTSQGHGTAGYSFMEGWSSPKRFPFISFCRFEASSFGCPCPTPVAVQFATAWLSHRHSLPH